LLSIFAPVLSVFFSISSVYFLCLINDPSLALLYSLSLHDSLPILVIMKIYFVLLCISLAKLSASDLAAQTLTLNAEDIELKAIRSEEHTSELQSRENLVCRLLLEKKKNK